MKKIMLIACLLTSGAQAATEDLVVQPFQDAEWWKPGIDCIDHKDRSAKIGLLAEAQNKSGNWFNKR